MDIDSKPKSTRASFFSSDDRPKPATNEFTFAPEGGDSALEGPEQRRKSSKSEVVAQHILAQIGNGQFKAGDKLPSETELMALLDVGRSSIREATSGLALIGLLQITRRRGTVVVAAGLGSLGDHLRNQSNYWVIRDLEEVRILLEGFATARAAERADTLQLREIEEAAESLEAKAKLEQLYFDENTQFHLAIAKASHNSALVFCLGSIIERFQSTRDRLNWTPLVREKDVREHRLILEAIRERQPALARALMEAHLTRNIARLEKPE